MYLCQHRCFFLIFWIIFYSYGMCCFIPPPLLITLCGINLSRHAFIISVKWFHMSFTFVAVLVFLANSVVANFFMLYSWCATRNHVPDSTYHLDDLTSVTTESWNVSPCMSATQWSRVNWKMCDENSTFGCFDAICTQSVSHYHTVVPFMTFLAVLTDRTSWIGFFTARWQWQHVRAARARSSKQNIRANISVFCLQIWPSIKSRAINCFNKCVFGFYSHWKVWYKSEKAFGMCSEWHYTTQGLAYGDMTARPTGSLSCLHPPISLVV